MITSTVKNIYNSFLGGSMKVTGKQERDNAVKALAVALPLSDLLNEITDAKYADAKFYTEQGIEIAEVVFNNVVYEGGIAQWTVATYDTDRTGFKPSGYVVYDDSLIYINHSPVRRKNYNVQLAQ